MYELRPFRFLFLFFFDCEIWKKVFPHQRSVRFKFPCQPTGRGKCLCVCACMRVACARARSVRVAYIILLCGMLVCARGRERTAVLRNDFRLLINCVKNEKKILIIKIPTSPSHSFSKTHLRAYLILLVGRRLVSPHVKQLYYVYV